MSSINNFSNNETSPSEVVDEFDDFGWFPDNN